MYRDIQSSNDSFFLIDSDKGILAYDVVDDRRIRVLIEHIINPPIGKNKLIFYSRRYELCKSEDGQVFFTMFKDSESGKLGIVDDRLRVFLPPEYDDVIYNSIGKTFTAICSDRTEIYMLVQLEKKWDISKPILHLNRFPEEVPEEEINRRVLDDEYSTILFVDPEA